ncbi:MAG: glutamate-5-semialdehyde dehydrogenase [Bacteroidales bacterium]|jgi:glutamate-5-semialdehyde dehydrogenase|nr:glutamate-5-semialdehyde dehydrogenase [Bacteroidales bacterium]
MDYSIIFSKVKQASRSFQESDKVNDLLVYLADLLEKNVQDLLDANQKDLDKMEKTDPKYDRLKLTDRRITDIAGDMRNVALLPSPLNRILEETIRPNGLQIQKISVPIGVIGIIYEARPNVTCDVFSLCIKSGNACILKGGSDAQNSNEAIVTLIHQALDHFNISPDMIALLPPERDATFALLNARGSVDIVIPRGSQGLIDFVCENAKVPVIETGAGIVHTYFDKTGNRDKGSAIINNAKTRRVSVCNALDCLIIHSKKLTDLPYLLNPLADAHVMIYADERSYQMLKGRYPADLLHPADENSFGTEFLDYKMSVKTVDNIEEALEHIERYSSRHSEAIISEDAQNIELFLNRVDAAAVYNNVSTAFTDGAQFGMGAEIGISTQKLHARGPMGLKELTSYKWVVRGNGQIRS